MEKLRIENILNIEKIENELELEQANSIFNKLRVLMKEDPSLKPIRKHLANLIEVYEAEHWTDQEKVTEEQILAGEKAEEIIQYQDQFIQKRKELIKNALKANGLIQNDLTDILGHRKNYVSELINGVRPFSQEDSIIIHRYFGIPLDHLIITLIKEPTVNRIDLALGKLNQPHLKLTGFNVKTDTKSSTRKSKQYSRIDRVAKDVKFETPKGIEINWSVFSKMRENRNLISL